MPRLTQSNPKYRRHRASGQAVVTIHGRDHYLGPWNTKASKAEYDRLIGEWLANGRQDIKAGSGLTVSELADQFLQYAQTYYRDAACNPAREADNFKPSLTLLRRLYGPTRAADFGPLALDALRLKMIEGGRCRNGVNRHAARIKMIFKWAVAKELIPASVHHALSAVSGIRAGRSDARESEPVRPVDNAVVDATLPHLSSVVAAMVQVQRLTGARGGEVCMMRTADIDTSGPVWTYKPTCHKTAHHGHQRVIHVGPKAQDILRPFLKPLNATAYIFSPKDAAAERRERLHAGRVTPISCGNRPGSNVKAKPKRRPGDKYTSTAYAKAVSRATDTADLWAKGGIIIANDERLIPHWHPHQLRHGAATAIRKQFGVEGAQTVLGHTLTWESSAAFHLEMSPAVKWYVRNDHLELMIPYEYQGLDHAYGPDFLARLQNDLTVLVEVKGEEDDKDKAKHNAARRWVDAVNNWGELGKWHLHVCYDPQLLAKELNDLLKASTAPRAD